MSALEKDTLKRSPMGSGRFIDPWDVKPEDIHIEDIARGLAYMNRYNGQFGSYSVAQHSILVARILPPYLRVPGLLHDSPEYITGDLVHHIKHGRGFLGMLFHDLEKPIQAAVEERFGISPGGLYSAEVKQADYKVFQMEWDHFVRGKAADVGLMAAWSAEEAERLFLAEFEFCYTGS